MKAPILSFSELERQGRGIIMKAPRLLLVKSKLFRKNRAWPHPILSIKIANTTPIKEAANGSRSDKNIIFLSAMIVYFRPTCAGWPCSTYVLHTAHTQRRVFYLKKGPLIFACNQAMKNVALLPLCSFFGGVLHTLVLHHKYLNKYKYWKHFRALIRVPLVIHIFTTGPSCLYTGFFKFLKFLYG